MAVSVAAVAPAEADWEGRRRGAGGYQAGRGRDREGQGLRRDDNHSSGETRQILVSNNLFTDIDAKTWGGRVVSGRRT